MHVSEWNVSWSIAFLNTSLIRTLAYDIVQRYVDDRIPKVISPAFYNWTDTLSHIPQKFNNTHMYEYLMKREVIVLSTDGVIIDNVMLPVAEKPLQSVCVHMAGRGGKCNHVGAILIARVEFRESQMKTSWTGQPQQWHLPSRTSKKRTKPQIIGETLKVYHP